MDNPGYVEAHDPVSGEMKWRLYTVPQKKGDPGSETWPNEEVDEARRRHDVDAGDLRSRI